MAKVSRDERDDDYEFTFFAREGQGRMWMEVGDGGCEAIDWNEMDYNPNQ